MTGHGRRLARRLVLATSVPPLLQVYRAGYGIVAWLALRLFRRHPAIRSVYLRRGASKGEIVPLVSDLDFAVIGGPFGDTERRELVEAYERLARRTNLLDATLEIFDEETLAARHRRSPHYRYRFTEGRATWRLLYGRDVLRDLPEPTFEELRGGCFAELQIWWMLFAWRLLQRRRYHAETVTRNSMCYKAVAEFLKVALAFREGRLVFRREEALEAATDLTADDAALAAELRACAARGFRREVPDVLARTTAFLLRRGAELGRAFDGLEDAAPGALPHQVDADPRDALHDPAGREALRRIVDEVGEGWPDVTRVAAVAGVGFNVDEVLVVLEATPGAVPEADRLIDLFAAHRRRGPAAARIHPFLRVGDAAFQLDGEDLEKSWQALLCPAANPEVFELLARPEATLFAREGAPRARPRAALRTGPHARHFLDEERRLFGELLNDPAIYKVPALEFQRVFWKTAQLAVADASTRAGRVGYALTPPAIERGLDSLGAPLPASLRGLGPAYTAGLAGQDTDLGELVPQAVGYLREIAA